MRLQVGVSSELGMAVLGNEIGTRGVIYQKYVLSDRPGFAFIFPNGRFDGFSQSEIRTFFKPGTTALHAKITTYEFQNVSILIDDFNSGYFDEVWY